MYHFIIVGILIFYEIKLHIRKKVIYANARIFSSSLNVSDEGFAVKRGDAVLPTRLETSCNHAPQTSHNGGPIH